jgi:hypothetical protein
MNEAENLVVSNNSTIISTLSISSVSDLFKGEKTMNGAPWVAMR